VIKIGYDGGKTKGIKRHIVTDIMGNILAVNVHKANRHDTKGGVSYLTTFEFLSKRWRVERIFSWFRGYRRFAKDFEYTARSEEKFVYISHAHLLLKRL